MPLFKNTLKVYIVSLHIDVGDSIKEDEDIAIVETEKLTVNIKSPISGKITKLFAQENEKLDVGANFVEIDTSGDIGLLGDCKFNILSLK